MHLSLIIYTHLYLPYSFSSNQAIKRNSFIMLHLVFKNMYFLKIYLKETERQIDIDVRVLADSLPNHLHQ